ncbi:hypothetical protein HDV05_000101 [Chytridiales sp. JEL 0842]|nr:hypothetical protein HDV05_000101 [Chytridiales sp. JEL 0842]
MHILIIGGGACGAYHGAYLHNPSANIHVSVVCRSNYEVVLSQGFTIHDAKKKSDTPTIFKPHQVFRNTQEAADYINSLKPKRNREDEQVRARCFDHVMIFTKTTVDPVQLLRPLFAAAPSNKNTSTRSLDPPQTISLWQNGLGIEERVKTEFPSTTLISVVMYVGISQKAPSIIEATPVQKAVMGLYPRTQENITSIEIPDAEPSSSTTLVSHETHNLKAFEKLLKDAGLKTIVVDNIQAVRWHKSLWNATFGLVGLAAGGVDSQTLMDTPDALDLVRKLMGLISTAGKKVLGHSLPFELLGTYEDMMSITRKLGPYKASIILDWEKGNEMETECLFGNLIAQAKGVGADVRELEALYTVVKLMVKARGK